MIIKFFIYLCAILTQFLVNYGNFSQEKENQHAGYENVPPVPLDGAGQDGIIICFKLISCLRHRLRGYIVLYLL